MARPLVLVAALMLVGGAAARAQAPGAAPLEVGATAPDFSLRGATRYGVLRDPTRLSDFHGKTVVLAFFYRARSSG